jgi:quinoprotein glucose dehydrogenase
MKSVALFTLLGFGLIQVGQAQPGPSAPEYETTPAATDAELTPANGWPAPASYRAWTRSLGGQTSNHYSALDQISRNNVAGLQPAWTYHSNDGAYNLQCNPIIVGRTVYLPTAGGFIAALDGTTGRELWRFDPHSHGKRLEDQPARRGLLYWPGTGFRASGGARIFFTAGNYVYALHPSDGTPAVEFGQDGKAFLPEAGTVAGAIFRHILVVPGYNKDVYGYDAASGQLLWTFHTIPRPGEFGYDTWRGQEQGANCWSGMALDESRGIAYVSTGSPKPNYNGTRHLGDNLFSDCIVAIDATTGQRLWHFQEIRHDIWDLDVSAPPNLVTVKVRGRLIDAVAQVTKMGNTLLLDRVTGKPLFPFRRRRAPASGLPGEVAADYQPDLDLPQPFVRHQMAFSPDDITDRTPAARAFVMKQVENTDHGWFVPFTAGKPNVYYGMLGGGEWTGAGFDPATGRLYITSSEMPWRVRLLVNHDAPPAVPATRGEKIFQQNCAACHGPTLRGIGMVPSLAELRQRMDDKEVLALLKTGRSGMPPAPQLSASDKTLLLDFLMARDRPAAPPLQPGEPPRYVFGGYSMLWDNEGYPGIKPPWGLLNCLDLNTGKILWQVPLGEYAELTKAGLPKTGQLNFGGALVTAGGLVFATGTLDNKVRAFDSATGLELWSALLPLHGTGLPSTYEIDGRQYVVLSATGGGKLGGAPGDAWVAFALPRSR